MLRPPSPPLKFFDPLFDREAGSVVADLESEDVVLLVLLVAGTGVPLLTEVTVIVSTPPVWPGRVGSTVEMEVTKAVLSGTEDAVCVSKKVVSKLLLLGGVVSEESSLVDDGGGVVVGAESSDVGAVVVGAESSVSEVVVERETGLEVGGLESLDEVTTVKWSVRRSGEAAVSLTW